MPKTTTTKENERSDHKTRATKSDIEKGETASKSYYYDDAHGYEDFVDGEENEDGEVEFRGQN